MKKVTSSLLKLLGGCVVVCLALALLVYVNSNKPRQEDSITCVDDTIDLSTTVPHSIFHRDWQLETVDAHWEIRHYSGVIWVDRGEDLAHQLQKGETCEIFHRPLSKGT